MIKVNNVTKTYTLGKTFVNALNGINLEIKDAEFVSLAGASGSGKSTMLNLIGCLDKPTKGEIWIDDIEINKFKEKQLNNIRLHKIGFVFQSFNLIPVLNIYENVELPLLIMKDVSKEERKKRVEHFIEAVGLGKYSRHKPNELSGGQCQRVAIARALVTKPRIVLADEPTANLDSKNGLEVINLMREINKSEKTTFVFSTHDPKIIKSASRVIYIQDGRVSEEEM